MEDEAVEVPLRMLLALGIDLRHLRDVALAFADNWDLVADRVANRSPMAPLDVGTVLAGVDVVERCGDSCSDDDDRLLARMGEVAAWGTALRAALDDDPRLVLLGEHGRPSTKVGNLGRRGKLA